MPRRILISVMRHFCNATECRSDARNRWKNFCLLSAGAGRDYIGAL
jgi:hypothetical protein